MYEVTDRFLRTLRYSHTVVAKAELYRRGRLIGEDLPIISGSVVDDSTALIRRRISLQFPATRQILDLLPAEHPEDGGLWPLGNELRVWAGLDYEDGNEPEWVPQGIFRVSKPTIEDTGDDLTVSVAGFDRSKVISRARFVSPYNIKAGTNYVTAIKALVMSRMPTLTEDDLDFMTTSYTTPVLTFTNDDDPWEQAVIMAASIGAELFFRGNGKLVLRPEPDPLYMPSVFDYVEGEDCTMESISRTLDEEQTYNACVVSGESSSNQTPVQGVAYDLDPRSPTWYDPRFPKASIFGFAPQFITSKYVTTPNQANEAARANLLKKLGVVESVDFNAFPNFAHESNDVVFVERERVRVSAMHVLETLNIGLGENDSMSATTRKRRVI